jgi:hypothetical protein
VTRIAEARKKLILHVGLQKTGTSSIQVMLAGSGEALRDEGFFYPQLPASDLTVRSIRTSPFRHNILAASYADYRTAFERLHAEELTAFWVEMQNNPRNPILSAEDFSRQKDFSRLKAPMSAFSVEVVIYVRRQDLFAESLYNQRNKILVQRGDISFLSEDFLTEKDLFEFLRVQSYIPVLNFSNLLNRIKTQLAPDRIHLRSFNRASMNGGDVCADFCDIFGWDIDNLTRPKSEANGSISNQILEELKQTFLSRGTAAALSMMDDINRSVANGTDYSGPYGILSHRSRRALLAQYDQVNRDLAEAYGVFFTPLHADQ